MAYGSYIGFSRAEDSSHRGYLGRISKYSIDNKGFRVSYLELNLHVKPRECKQPAP